MSKKEDEYGWIDGLEPDPITPSKNLKSSECNSKGWQFYIKIKNHISDYWLEFNSTLNKKGTGNKYKYVRDFADSKFKNKEERHLFYLMTCSSREWETCATIDNSNKMLVPWLGDWIKIRKNGYWNGDNTYEVKKLKKAISEVVESSEAIKATAPFIIQQMKRFMRMQDKIDEAFAGELFLKEELPDKPKNKNRFRTYMKMQSAVVHELTKLWREWMRIHGVNPNDPQQMFNPAMLSQAMMNAGQIGAAGALSGVVAGRAGILLQGSNGEAPTLISRETLKLADHIMGRKEDFGDIPPAKAPVKVTGKHTTQ